MADNTKYSLEPGDIVDCEEIPQTDLKQSLNHICVIKSKLGVICAKIIQYGTDCINYQTNKYSGSMSTTDIEQLFIVKRVCFVPRF
jgi:hypothetical protein